MRQNEKNSEVMLALSLIILISCEMTGKSLDLFGIHFLICKIMGLGLVVTVPFSFKII